MACPLHQALGMANQIVSVKSQIRNLRRNIEILRARGGNTTNQERQLNALLARLADLEGRLNACLSNISCPSSAVASLSYQIANLRRTLETYAARGMGPGTPIYDSYNDRLEVLSRILNACQPNPCPSGYEKSSTLSCPSHQRKEPHPTRSDCAKCVDEPCPSGYTRASELVCVQCVGVTKETHPTRSDCARCVGTCTTEPCPEGYSDAASLTCSSGETKVYHPSRADCAKCVSNGSPPNQCPEGWTGTYPHCIDPRGTPRTCDATFTCWQDPVTQAIRSAPNTCDAENYRRRGYVLVDNRLCFNAPCPTGYEKKPDGTCQPIAPPPADVVGPFEWGRWGAWIVLGLGGLGLFYLYKKGYIKLSRR